MNEIKFRNQAQVILYEEELKGQISDGNWENSRPHNHWRVMCDAVASVGEPLGCNFKPLRDYDFDDEELVEDVGYRMLEYVRAEIPDYTEADLMSDLRDMSEIVNG